MATFFNNWTKGHDKGIKERVKETLGVHGPKPRIEARNSTIEAQISKLDNKILQSKNREVYLFNRIVAAIQSRNDTSAKMLSIELTKVRHNQNILNQARRTLEQVSIRSSTISDLSEVMEILEPVITPVRGLKSTMRKVLPDINNEINYVQMVTNSVMSESNQNSERNIDIVYPCNGSDNDIDQIIAEALHNSKE